MNYVIKRDGRKVSFKSEKIIAAVLAAFKDVDGEIDEYAVQKANNIANYIDGLAEEMSVEEIQDYVEKGLMSTARKDVAKAYILYRKKRSSLRNVSEALLNYKDTMNSYLNVDDWRVKENSTVTYSIGGLILSNSGAVTANYWLSEIYDTEIANAHRNADIHIHDLSMLSGYCAGWSLKQLIQEGLGGVPGKITSSPARHLSTLCNQMVNFLGIMQNEWAGKCVLA